MGKVLKAIVGNCSMVYLQFIQEGKKMFNSISMICSAVGAVLCKVMGGYDELLKTIILFIVLDYLTGVIKAIYLKKLSSEIGFKGILKKLIIFIVISAAYGIQNIMQDAIPLRETVIVFFIANEALSLLENAAVMTPVPEKLKDVLLQLRDTE